MHVNTADMSNYTNCLLPLFAHFNRRTFSLAQSVQHDGTIALFFKNWFESFVPISGCLVGSEEDQHNVKNMNYGCSDYKPKGVAEYC